MVLTPEMRRKLHKALVDAFPTTEELGLLVFLHLPTNVQDASSNRQPALIVKDLIEWAEKTGHMQQLLDGAVAQDSSNPTLNAVVAAIRPMVLQTVPAYVAPDPFETCLTRDNVPFVNRSELRTALRTLIAVNGAPVLAVQGNSRTGKSYTSHLISYLSTQVVRPGGGQLYRIVSMHLADQPAGFDAGALAKLFALEVGSNPESIPVKSDSEQEARWASYVAAWITGQLVPAAERLQCDQIWLVVDGFQQATVAPSTIEVLRHVAASASVQRTHLRLILLDYPDALPGIERLVQRDRVRPATRADVVLYLEKILAGTGRTMQPQTLQSVADAIWGEALPEDAGLMPRLDEAICRRLPLLLEKKS